MVPKIVLQILCTPVAIVAVTLYFTVIVIDGTANKLFGEVWRERVGPI